MPRKETGEWVHLDPLSERGFVQANAWQATFGLSHDIETLARLMGGNDSLATQLNYVFEMSKNARFLSSYVSYANQPGCSNAHVFSHVGKPWLTQYWVRQIVERLYNATERGYPGDEDQGGMSSWYILSSLGIYAVCPGTDEYVIGSPLFKKATITMENGNKFVIEANNNSKENLYIQSATLNGRVLDKNFIRYDDIADGGIIRFEMGSQPNKERCTSKYAAPFSLSKE